jgi:tight adherence protein B
MRSPTREEFGIVCGDINLGGSVERALLRLHDRTRVSEYAIFAMVVSVQTQGGGRLTESLQHLADMVRQRVSIGQRAKALAGEAKMSAIILMVLPFLAGGALSMMNPGYLDPLFADPRGIRLFMIAVICLVMGGLVMRAMIKWAVGGA